MSSVRYMAGEPAKPWWNVALLGSEDAVQEYVEGKQDDTSDRDPDHDGPTDLFGNPIPAKPEQTKMF